VAEPPDRVQLVKQESAALGGDGAEEVPYDSPIEPQEDAIEVAGVYYQDASNRDENVLTWREDDDMMFKDVSNPSGYTLTQLASGSASLDNIILDESGRIVYVGNGLFVLRG